MPDKLRSLEEAALATVKTGVMKNTETQKAYLATQYKSACACQQLYAEKQDKGHAEPHCYFCSYRDMCTRKQENIKRSIKMLIPSLILNCLLISLGQI